MPVLMFVTTSRFEHVADMAVSAEVAIYVARMPAESIVAPIVPSIDVMRWMLISSPDRSLWIHWTTFEQVFLARFA
jgi:hypothetical protein